ncbi:MAG: dihydroorotase [Deltaproteobacteria bacterium]|nr:dihydroorotase [Deltaproteobacteria bacterium]MBW1962815.1 dihydroorotase [Deltaproteobacteria bacterium]MBW1995220.1 dihydroorotase [Deltaproteobacteria bacterium]MBW2151592.1 dihydroorotase [Deltaproteobacteria bacterium]
MRTLIKNGRVIDPGNLDGLMDILIEDEKIAAITAVPPDGSRQGASVDEPDPSRPIDRIIDASGKVVAPGLIDMHVHLREPGFEYKETIESGCLAAAAGGFTAVCTMPNTHPVNDNSQVTRFILRKAEMAATAQVYPIAAVSINRRGESLCEFGDLKEAGAVALSDDGGPVVNSELLRRALEYAKLFQLPIISHCEDLYLSGSGVMNEGVVATRLGLAGIPNAAESIITMRDIALCELTESPLHIAHVSTAESVRVISEAKARGLPVTAETAPHYFLLTEEAVEAYNTNAKMNPPLRSARDRDAILEALSDGTIDVIATDHAPQTSIEKDTEFDMAENGIIGLETSLALSLKLVEKGVLSLTALIEKMSKNPGRIIHRENCIRIGAIANITIIDTDQDHVIDAKRFKSLSRNTPFDRWHVKGKAVLTMVKGKVVFEDLQ